MKCQPLHESVYFLCAASVTLWEKNTLTFINYVINIKDIPYVIAIRISSYVIYMLCYIYIHELSIVMDVRTDFGSLYLPIYFDTVITRNQDLHIKI